MANKYNINKRKQYLDLFKNDLLEYTIDLTTFIIYIGGTDKRITTNDGSKVGAILRNTTDCTFFKKVIEIAKNYDYHNFPNVRSYSTIYRNVNSYQTANTLQQVNEMLYAQGLLTDADEPLPWGDCNMLVNHFKSMLKYLKQTNCTVNHYVEMCHSFGDVFIENPMKYANLSTFAEEICTPNFMSNWTGYRGQVTTMELLYKHRKWFRRVRNNFFLLMDTKMYEYPRDTYKMEWVRTFSTALGEYLNYVDKLEIEPAPIHSLEQMCILSDEVKEMYEARKDELLSKALSTKADLYSKKLFVEDENFTMVYPRSTMDFKKEAEYQHNCLYRFGYMDRVVENRSIIVFIRKKNDIDTPYVTCELVIDDDRPYINQFYTKYNANPYGDEITKYKDRLTTAIRTLSL